MPWAGQGSAAELVILYSPVSTDDQAMSGLRLADQRAKLEASGGPAPA